MTESESLIEFAPYVPAWPNVSSTSDREPLKSLGDAVICVVAAILSVVTAGGNLLVVISYRMDRHLQTVSNYFLLSLSLADFTIGVVSMPLYTAYLVLGYWPTLVRVFWGAHDYGVNEYQQRIDDHTALLRFV